MSQQNNIPLGIALMTATSFVFAVPNCPLNTKLEDTNSQLEKTNSQLADANVQLEETNAALENDLERLAAEHGDRRDTTVCLLDTRIAIQEKLMLGNSHIEVLTARSGLNNGGIWG